MFELITTEKRSFGNTVFRGCYLFTAGVVTAGFLFVVFFPGSTKDEQFERFIIGSGLLFLSLLISAPVAVYVGWKLANHEKPMFWGPVLLTGALPLLIMIAIIIWQKIFYF